MIFDMTTKMVQNIIVEEMKVLDYSQELLAVDCTMGNGHDTLFLSQLLEGRGQVYSMDIQQYALESTAKLLENNGRKNVTLVLDGHENVNAYVKEIDIAMFNLGYLPKGDHGLITKPETTVQAIDQVVKMLKSKGIVSIISYYGHEGGRAEKDSVELLTRSLNQKKFDVIRIEQGNRGNNPPIVTFIRKK